MPRDLWDRTIERLADAGIIQSNERITSLHGSDLASVDLADPIVAAARADIRIIGLIQRMLKLSEFDREFLAVVFDEFLAQSNADAETPVSDE